MQFDCATVCGNCDDAPEALDMLKPAQFRIKLWSVRRLTRSNQPYGLWAMQCSLDGAAAA